MVKMTVPIKNKIFDKITEAKSITDVELSKALKKDDIIIADDRFNKLLLDLEIMGLIKVSWLTKDTKRIEVIIQKKEIDEVERQNKERIEKDYESSFPGAGQ